ncbi:hypothetical protein [Brucella pseudogrignonensis]
MSIRHQKNCIFMVWWSVTGTIFVSLSSNRSFQRRRV